MVVYSILTTQSDTQYVRVYSSYNPANNDPSRNPDELYVTDARVTISDGANTFTLRDTTLERADTSRYQTPIMVYYAYPFRPEKGKTYTLTVSSASLGTVTATTTAPGKGSVSPYNSFVLGQPYTSPYDYGLTALLANEAKAFVAHFYVDYLEPNLGSYVPKRFEVPIRRDLVSAYYDLYREIFPQPKRRTTPSSVYNPGLFGERPQPEERVPYNTSAYASKLKSLYDINGCSLKFIQAVFYLIQFDAPLWNYYSVANTFRDRNSIRLDQPDYTNINGGVGVFGSITVDSLVYPLPEKIPPPPSPGTAGCR